MTRRGQALLLLASASLLNGLAWGEQIFYLSAIFIVLCFLFALLSLLLSYKKQPFCALSAAKTPHGEPVEMQLHLPRRGLLPISPWEITLHLGSEECTLYAEAAFSRQTTQRVPVPAPHVGQFDCGILQTRVTDVLGLLQYRRRFAARQTLLVLPRSFEVSPLRFLSADDGRALPNRTTEDLSSPDDTRAYQAGDALKRMHWKLTMRRQELTVRRYETPAPPDTLLLMDCAPPAAKDESDAAFLRDALCETALSVAAMQISHDSPVRMPLYGRNAQEFLSGREAGVALLQEMLSCQPFDSATDFGSVLALELRRMRRTGATVLLTTRLNAPIVEGIKHIRRMGPSARVYLITRTPDAPEDRPYVSQLQQCFVEVCYVSPA